MLLIILRWSEIKNIMIYKKNIKTSLKLSESLWEHLNEPSYAKLDYVKMINAYQGAMKEISTKLEILDDEFQTLYDHNPVHHIESRIKSSDSILGKLDRKGLEPTIQNIRDHITDVVGLRIICPYIEDVYNVVDLLCSQKDIKLIKKTDYINNPKKNGYRSLHLVLSVPVAMSDRIEQVCVEIQIRTIAMDMWASLEHELHYKSIQSPVEHLSERLRRCAISLSDIDLRMQEIYDYLKFNQEDLEKGKIETVI